MTPMLSAELLKIEKYQENKRLKYFLEQVIKHNEIWVLTDEHGCMMLNTDNDDCVPVWPNKEFAQTWINGDWQNCQAQAIDLKTWFSRWTTGLLDDELSIVVFPNQQQEGLVLFADEFEFELKMEQKQQYKNKKD
jgi:hypothetical protein